MPELPEVETVREGVHHHVVGCVIERVRILDERSIRRHIGGSADFTMRLEGARIRGAYRRGKYMWLTLSAPEDEPFPKRGDSDDTLLPYALVIHLGMSGQLLVKTPEFPAEKHLKIILELELADGESTNKATELRFVDQRIFGGMFLSNLVPDIPAGTSPAGAEEISEDFLVPEAVEHIGRDPVDPSFDVAKIRRIMLRTSSGIKRLLLDQSVVSGIGNIYADEALWRARIHYAKPAKSLSATQTRELFAAVHQVLTEALHAGGTSFDALYVNVNGQSGYFDRSLNAYGRAGEPCRRCLEAGRTSIIVREPFMNRSSYRCPHCQRTPRGLKIS